MNPTLRAGDSLRVIPYEDSEIRIGDVVVFCPPGCDHNVTHRVISVASEGIRTRGDNSNNVDSWVLTPDHILGRVIYAQRGNRRLRIYGGPTGRLSVVAAKTIRKIKSVRAVRIIKSGISSLLHPPYHWLAQSGVFRQWLPARVEIQVLSFSRPAGTELQLLMGWRVIGRRLPGKGQWQIRRPFRLFVDEAALPRGEPGHHPTTPESRAL